MSPIVLMKIPFLRTALKARCCQTTSPSGEQNKTCTAPKQHKGASFAAELEPHPSCFPSFSPISFFFGAFPHLSPSPTGPNRRAWSQRWLLPQLLLQQRRRRRRRGQQCMRRGFGPVASKEEAQGVLELVTPLEDRMVSA